MSDPTDPSVWAATLREKAKQIAPQLGYDKYQEIVTAIWKYAEAEGHPPTTPADHRALLDAIRVGTSEIQRAGGFNFLSKAELDATPGVQYLVDGVLVTDGTSILVSPPRKGKTILALNQARAVVLGEPFLGRETIKGPVLYLALEAARSIWSSLIREIDIPIGPDKFNIQIGPPADEDQGFDYAAAIRAHNARLVIIDTFVRLGDIEDIRNYSQIDRAMRPFIRIANECHCHIQALHHSPKRDEVSGSQAILGSTGIGAAIDTWLELRVDENGTRTLSSENPRYGEVFSDLPLAFDPATKRITPGGITAKQNHRAAAEAVLDQRILAKIGEDWIKQSDLLGVIGGDTSKAIGSLKRLVAARKIERAGEGGKKDPIRFRRAV